jgi:alpha-beta hydrolase superfamily lysophospholipase
VTGDPAFRLALPAGEARGVALVLHGGRAKSSAPVRATNLTVLRMAPFAAALRHAGAAHGLAVARLRYLVRGWNGSLRSPVADVQWALDRISEQFPDVPVALVGHSMGGRAAIYSAAAPSVRSVVGLAPWIEPDDPVRTVAGRHVLVVHGDRDRMTSPRGSAAWTRRAAAVAASAAYVNVAGERHAMVHRAGLWHSLASTYVLATLCGVAPEESDTAAGANVIAKVLAGDTSLVV